MMKPIQTIIALAIVAGAIAMIVSCTSHNKSISRDSVEYKPTKIPIREMDDLGHIHNVDTISVDTLEKRYYKAKCLENGTMTLITNLEPISLQETVYHPGDTVWVNLNTHMVDDQDDTAMKYVIRSIAH